MLVKPSAGGERLHQAAVKTTWGAVVEVFQTGLAQAGRASRWASATLSRSTASRSTPRGPAPCWNWRQTDLATASGVSEIAIKNIERGATDPRVTTVNNIQEAFGRAGVILLTRATFATAGVRLKRF